MNQRFALIEMNSGTVQSVDVYGTQQQAEVALFDCLKDYVGEHPLFRESLEQCAREMPEGKFGQFLQGLDNADVVSTVDAYDWLIKESCMTPPASPL